MKTGLIAASELDRILLDMQRASTDENVVVFMPRMLQVVATRES